MPTEFLAILMDGDRTVVNRASQLLHRHDFHVVSTIRFSMSATTVNALRRGAFEFIEAALDPTKVPQMVTAAGPHESLPASETSTIEPHSLARWASMVVRTLDAARDPTTLQKWGHHIGASQGTVRNWCRSARMSARNSLLFARLLRAVVRHESSMARVEDLLDVVDRRTLAKLLKLGGAKPPHDDALPASIDDFLREQQLILNAHAISQVRNTLERVRTERGAIDDRMTRGTKEGERG